MFKYWSASMEVKSHIYRYVLDASQGIECNVQGFNLLLGVNQQNYK